MEDPCRYCGQAPELAEHGMCADCQKREEADAAREWPHVVAYMAEQDHAADPWFSYAFNTSFEAASFAQEVVGARVDAMRLHNEVYTQLPPVLCGPRWQALMHRDGHGGYAAHPVDPVQVAVATAQRNAERAADEIVRWQNHLTAAHADIATAQTQVAWLGARLAAVRVAWHELDGTRQQREVRYFAPAVAAALDALDGDDEKQQGAR